MAKLKHLTGWFSKKSLIFVANQPEVSLQDECWQTKTKFFVLIYVQRAFINWMMNADIELLRKYAADQSERAFETLVSRYAGLVHSAALRQVRSSHLAEEITQTVFIILARKAGSISPKTILSGWLYRTTCYVSAAALKIQRRREHHEKEANIEAMIPDPQTDLFWEQLAPLLDEAMAQLRDKDRNAIVLRYFQNKSLRDVGAAFGVDEYAAQKRVGRAVEKLRVFFSKRGIDSTTAAIAGMISASSVQAVPPALVKSVTAAVITKGAAASTSTLTLIKGALKIMAWAKAKTMIVAGVVGVLAVGTMTVVVHKNPAPFVDFVVFSKTKQLSNYEEALYAKWAGTTPEQAAKNFFEACSRENWPEVAKFWNTPGTQDPLNDKDKKVWGGLQIVNLGKPFWAWYRFRGTKYNGVFVPYEVRLKDGTVKTSQLAVRCDNPAKRWYVDGGMF